MDKQNVTVSSQLLKAFSIVVQNLIYKHLSTIGGCVMFPPILTFYSISHVAEVFLIHRAIRLSDRVDGQRIIKQLVRIILGLDLL